MKDRFREERKKEIRVKRVNYDETELKNPQSLSPDSRIKQQTNSAELKRELKASKDKEFETSLTKNIELLSNKLRSLQSLVSMKNEILEQEIEKADAQILFQ